MSFPDFVFPVAPTELTRLHERLTRRAEDESLLDVGYRRIDSPLGSLLLAATDRGLVRIAFETEVEADVLQLLADRISPRVLEAPGRLDRVARQLDEYFAGRRRRFDLDLDWRLSHGFRLAVLHHLATDIGYGHTASYTTLAGLAGNQRAVRAAATACATNPIPIVVPCHRVVRADGSVGQYRGGPAAKRELLELERSS